MKKYRSVGAVVLVIAALLVLAPQPLAAQSQGRGSELFSEFLAWLNDLFYFPFLGGFHFEPVKNALQAEPTLPAVPFDQGISIQPSSTSTTVLARQADGTYVSLQFGTALPYPVQNTSVLTQWLSGGLQSLLAASAAPPEPHPSHNHVLSQNLKPTERSWSRAVVAV